jgi:mannose-6-phosphate isomerase-like protein (cupin superfamily)
MTTRAVLGSLLIIATTIGDAACDPKPDASSPSATVTSASSAPHTATAIVSATADPAPIASASPFVLTAFPTSPPAFEPVIACPKGTCPIKLDLPKTNAPAANGPAPAKLFEVSIGPGARVDLPRDDALTVIAVVLTGKVKDTPSEPMTASKDGEIRAEHVPLEGVLYRGAGLSLTAETASRVLVAVTIGRGQPFVARGKPWTKRPGTPDSIRRFDIHRPPLVWGGGAFNAAMGLEDQGPGSDGGAGARLDAACELLGIAPGAAVPTHDHANEWELLAIVAGEGEMTIAGAKQAVAPGKLVAIPKAVPHSFQASTRGPVIAIQLYVPPGPEQRFRKAAAQ